MSIFTIIAYPLFLIAVLEITLSIVLVRNNPQKSRVQNAVAVLAFFSSAFAFLSALMYLRAGLGLSIDLIARLNWIGWFTVPAALQILYYQKDDSGRAGHIIGIVLYPVWLVVLGLCLFTDLIVAPGYSVIPFINHPGPLENTARLFGSVLAVWLLVSTSRFKKELRGIKKAQLNYFFQGVLIFGGGAAFTAGFMQIFGGFGFEPGLASFFSFPWVALTYYAITRHRLFDIRLIFSRVLAVILLVILFSLIQIGLLNLLIPALGQSFAILASLSVIAVIFYGTRISRKMQGWVQQLLLQDKYDYQGVLKESIKAITTMLELDELLGYIIATMKKSLGVDKAYLILKGKDGNFSLMHRQAVSQIGVQESALNETLAPWLLSSGHGVVREELEGQSPDLARVREAMKKIGAELILPLVYKGDIKGFMVLGEKGNQDHYLQSDIDLLESLAGHAAVAIENAQLYEDARQAKGSMRESEAKFQTLAETAAMGIFMHQGGDFLYANRAAEVIGGYSVHEYMTMNFLGLVHPDFIDLVKARARERLGGGSEVPAQYEFKIVRKDREERWVLMTAGISEFEGKPTVIGSLIDINARKQAEQEREEYYRRLQAATQSLRESEAKFRSLAETAPAAIFIHQGGKFIYANAASVSMTGYTHEEFIGMDFWVVTHPEDREMVLQRGRARLVGEAIPERYELRIVTKRGEVRWVDMTVGLIEYEGKPAVIGNAFDITDRKMAENERERYFEELQAATHSLQESESRFRTLAETTTAAIFIHQGQKLVYANPAGTTITGYTNEELLQEDFWSLIHPDYQEMVLRGQVRGRTDHDQNDSEYRFIKKNGDECWVSMTAGFIEFGGKPAIIATLFNITDWKRAEEAKVKFYEESVRQYQERIEEEKRHRMEKEKILMDLHDGIGGITTNINILSELALKSGDRENREKLLSTISQLSREGIAEIRSFMHSLDSKDLNWRTLAAELRKQGSQMVETHNINFTIEMDVQESQEQPGSLTWVNVFKIYKEALTNVIKHSRATSVVVGFGVKADGVLLTVWDDGVGGHGKRTGGRGLSHMKTRAEDIGGKVSFLIDRGTTVRFELPLPLKYPAGSMVIH